MISFNDINFQWETEGEQKRLVIVVNNAQEPAQDIKTIYEEAITNTLKRVFNG